LFLGEKNCFTLYCAGADGISYSPLFHLRNCLLSYIAPQDGKVKIVIDGQK